MDKKIERILILISDFLSINLAWIFYYYFKIESGLFERVFSPDFWIPMLVVYFYWVVIFTFVGMYKTWFATSRFDELNTLFKASFFGVFIIFFTIMYDDSVDGFQSTSRFIIFIYWGFLLFFTGSGRLIVRSIQRSLLINGIGRKNALIVGFNEKAHNIHNSIIKYRGLGLDVVAYAAVKQENVGKDFKQIKAVNTVANIQTIIKDLNIRQVIIALEKHEEEIFYEVIEKTDNMNVSLKIVPDLYEIISGQARTTQIYGFPLIDLMPQLMPEWEKKLKRLLDIVVSFLIIIVSLPATILTTIAIKLDSPGGIFFFQERLGMNSRPMKVIKFRSMVNDAEKKSGPVWSTKGDPRITRVGKFIRKVRIDEIPQMINVLRGEMSLVGPRPERAYFVEKLSQEIPLYKRRLAVRPGVTGWAQVKHKYDETTEDVKTKLKYDLFYIENMSVRMDILILFRTIFVVLFGKGHFN